MIWQVKTSWHDLHSIRQLNPSKAQLESTLIKLVNADTQIEDLKLQLDDALGAEEMVVQLTERTLMLGEVTTVLRTNDSSCLYVSIEN